MDSNRTATQKVFTSVTEKLSGYEDIFYIEGKGLSLYLYRNFLSDKECTEVIALIERDNKPSTVLGGDLPHSDYRTSHSSPLAFSGDPIIGEIDKRIAAFTGIGLEFQESIEGQRYLPGQQFQPHLDAFLPDQDYWADQKAVGGQRTWTVMIALNTPDVGGATAFPEAGLRVQPRAGNLLAWSNLDQDGIINPASLHCGEPVHEGVKYILTKWHREEPFRPSAREKKQIRIVLFNKGEAI